MKEKFKNYSFWISFAGAVILLLNNLGKIFGFTVDNEAIFSIVDGVCGVLVVFGVLTMPNKKSDDANTESVEESTEEENQTIDDKDDIETK